MARQKWGWFRKENGGWIRRKYVVGEERPEKGPPDAMEFWCGGTGHARNLTNAERDALIIQTGKDFGPGATLRDVEKYGKETGIGFRIAEQDDTRRFKDAPGYREQRDKAAAGKALARAKKLLTSRPEYAKNAETGGIHAEQARQEGRE